MATPDEQKLAGGVAVVTGAGAGIGSGIARRLGELGMTVIVTDIVTAKAEEVAQHIQSRGGKAEAMTVDVSKPSELDRLAEDIFAKHGSVRLLVNNAGIETLGFTWEIPAARWEATLNINIHGVVHGVRAFAPRMLATGEECWIANLSSMGGFGMMPTQTAYIMTKHAVQSFTECLFLEMEIKKAPIHVCCVMPGMLKTSIFDLSTDPGVDESPFKRTMYELMKNHGMDLDEGCHKIVRQIAEKRFWVETQPEMIDDALSSRIAYMQGKENPKLGEQTRALLGLSSKE
jgi:NAD(P)-dependent dehydrogenase (short-subunit alcohol dehydrogenase family)